MQSSLALEWWLNKVDTDLDLADSIVEYVQQRGTVLMEDIVQEAPCRFQVVGKSQDKIASEVQSKMIIMGHQILSYHVLVVRSFFIL